MIKKAFFSALLFTSAFFLQAHEFNPAHLVVKEIEANSYEAEWMYPVKNIGARGEVYFPDSCKRETKQIEKKGKYLVESIKKFYNQEQLAELMKNNGFSNVEFRNVSSGVSAIHSGWKI